MRIRVGMNTLTKNMILNLNYEKNQAICNGVAVEIDVKPFCEKLLTIVSSWDKKMVNTNILDGLSYYVKIEKDGKKYSYVGQNKFPHNFNEFLELLSENKIW